MGRMRLEHTPPERLAQQQTLALLFAARRT